MKCRRAKYFQSADSVTVRGLWLQRAELQTFAILYAYFHLERGSCAEETSENLHADKRPFSIFRLLCILEAFFFFKI